MNNLFENLAYNAITIIPILVFVRILYCWVFTLPLKFMTNLAKSLDI